jgi:hypothetical protein
MPCLCLKANLHSAFSGFVPVFHGIPALLLWLVSCFSCSFRLSQASMAIELPPPFFDYDWCIIMWLMDGCHMDVGVIEK